MKKILLLYSSFLLGCIFTRAQLPLKKPWFEKKLQEDHLYNTTPFNKILTDSLKIPKNNSNGIFGNMLVFSSAPQKLTLIENNNKGFDIYQTSHDNMYISKPDSTFISDMPVKAYEFNPQNKLQIIK